MSERKWKLGDDCCSEDAILGPVTFNDIITAVHCNCREKNKDAVIKTAREMLKMREEDFWFMVNNNIQEIIDDATPEEQKPLRNAPGWDSKRLENLAWEIQKWLLSHDMWMDVAIYYDGKCMSTSHRNADGKWEFRYNGEPFIEEGKDPRDYFDYVANPHILSMSFEGSLCHLLSYGVGGAKLEREFYDIFRRHGLRCELGDHWNLTCYER